MFDWDNPEEILSLLKSLMGINQCKIFARKCEIKEIDKKIADDFSLRHHRQKGILRTKIAYGLYYQEELVQIMTFSKERFKKSTNDNSYELLRLCSKPGVKIVGGASKLFKAFCNSSYQPEYIKSFVDYSKGQGKVYERMGMTFEGLANLNALYANIDTGHAMKVTRVTQKYKKEYENLGLTQQEFMNKKRYFRINDAGNKVFSWTKMV